MTTKESQYLLATYIDGPYFQSALEVLLYPTGCSFYRPFSYRKDWTDTEIQEMKNENKNVNKGFIGIRFLDEKKNGSRPLFIPLRKVDYVTVRYRDGYQVRFRLGHFIAHPENNKFHSFDLSQKLSDKYSRNNALLFAIINPDFVDELNRLPTVEETPPNLWEKFMEDPNLMHEAVNTLKGTCMLRLIAIRQRNPHKLITPLQIENEKSGQEKNWGYKFEVGKIYDLDLIHNTLVPKGITSQLGKTSFECTTPDERLKLSRNLIPQTGNYREEKIWLQARRQEPAATQLEWEPRFDKNQSAVGFGLPLRVPYLAKSPLWYKFRPGLLWFGIFFWLLALAFFSSAVLASMNPCWPQPVIWVALGGVCAPMGFHTLSKWIDEHSKLSQ